MCPVEKFFARSAMISNGCKIINLSKKKNHYRRVLVKKKLS